MNRSIAKGIKLSSIVLAGVLCAVGCGNKASTPMNSGVTDVTAPAPAYSQPAPMTSAQPITYDTMPSASASTSNAGAIGGGSGPYTVKRGDTLYSIARTHYGDGKQWQKIAAANPGVRPESLKVGQTISIP